jgi:hypothetical protein
MNDVAINVEPDVALVVAYDIQISLRKPSRGLKREISTNGTLCQIKASTFDLWSNIQ